ncbi:hypothetical protein FRB97_003903 [Tulasnella sp. 331]|nr:hypothetical protein FRB97_003903 [Tulasnella sp. 331]
MQVSAISQREESLLIIQYLPARRPKKPSPIIPPEIIGQVLEYVGLDSKFRHRDLKNVTLCSIALFIETERILYSSIELRKEGQARKLLYALRACPRGFLRRKYVTSIHVSTTNNTLSMVNEEFFLFTIRQILKLTPNLLDLAIRGHEGTDVLMAAVKNYPFRLRSLRMKHCYGNLTPLLIAQPAITTLQLDLSLSDTFLASALYLGGTLPHLEEIEASPQVLAHLVTGRSMSRISTVVKSGSDIHDLGEALSKFATPIRVLKMRLCCDISANLLTPLSRNLVDLERLEIYQSEQDRTVRDPTFLVDD